MLATVLIGVLALIWITLMLTHLVLSRKLFRWLREHDTVFWEYLGSPTGAPTSDFRSIYRVRRFLLGPRDRIKDSGTAKVARWASYLTRAMDGIFVVAAVLIVIVAIFG